jgi:hypothetical protein
MWYPSHRNDPAAFSIRTRLELWRAGISMMTTNPLFGIGLGRFYDLSHDYAGPMLESLSRPHENAHNYFVQVLAELGVPGLLLFVAVIGFSLQNGRGSLHERASSSGWRAGPVAFLLTSLTGHPFVVPEAAYPFWMVLGLAAVAASVTRADHGLLTRRWAPRICAVAIGLLVLTLPVRAREAVRRANLENTIVGLTSWHQDPEGVRFRWSAARSTFFVPSAVRSIGVPLRRGPDGPAALEVWIFLDGQPADRVALRAGDPWRTVRLVRLGRRAAADFVRIDLEAREPGAPMSLDTTASRVLMVGQPTMLWQQ